MNRPAAKGRTGPAPLVLACGALAADLRAVLAASGLGDRVEVEYLPAPLHNRPERIVPALRWRLEAARSAGRPVFVAYADCGTGGRLDALLREFPGVERLSGAHCYEFFAGADRFAALQHEEPGTFYLTDFLAKHFDALVWRGLGLQAHPELRDVYFGNYRRVVLLSQAVDARLVLEAAAIAERLGLAFEHRPAGRTHISFAIEAFTTSSMEAGSSTPGSSSTPTRSSTSARSSTPASSPLAVRSPDGMVA